MTREEAKKLLPIIHAFADGKIVEFFNEYEWEECEIPSFCSTPENYRIKTEKTEARYRPFRDCLECWKEMHKHSNFGWIKHKLNSNVCQFYIVGNIVNIEGKFRGFSECFKDFEFTDGTLFGIKEE